MVQKLVGVIMYYFEYDRHMRARCLAELDEVLCEWEQGEVLEYALRTHFCEGPLLTALLRTVEYDYD